MLHCIMFLRCQGLEYLLPPWCKHFSNSARHHHILSFIVGLEELLLCGLTDQSVPGNNVLGLY